MVSRDYIGNRKSICALVFGIAVGFLFAYLLISPPYEHYNVESPATPETLDWAGLFVGHNDQQEGELAMDNSVANTLFNEVKILCWVMTKPENHKTQAVHIMKTWGSRCNKLLFMSTAEDEEIAAISLPVEEGEDKLWNKTKEASKYIYNNHLDEYDWFLKADDDTYVIVENLRFLLYPYAAKTPIYFGCKYKQGFILSGAGYVLSREALRRFVEDGIPDKSKCQQQEDKGYENYEIGTCLESVHVKAGDTFDSVGKARFLPFTPEYLLMPDQFVPESFRLNWYWEFLYYKTGEGVKGCSDNAISFHHISGHQMHVLDYLIYDLRPYGIVRYSQLPRKLAV